MRTNRIESLVYGILAAALFILGMRLMVHKVHAKDFTPAQASQTAWVGLLTTSTNATNQLYVENNDFHTFHILASTNGAAVVLERSLDQTNWFPFSTNTWATTNVLLSEVTMTGKWSWVRARTVWTNGTYQVIYLGGR